ncbi:MAG TPA: flagellar filament capping protein FliD [Burkholderiaceae bacterium]|nr:flagellar filament capping protein FliD [Burkholderiaceae bacterium]
MTTIDPASLATQLASAYTQPMQTLLQQQQTRTQGVSGALTKLQSALQDFDSALLGLSGKHSLLQYGASFSAPIGTASTSATAQPGVYTVSVQQLATANSVAYSYPAGVQVNAGSPMTVHLAGGSSFTIQDLASSDTDADGQLSATELARAINTASGNGGMVTAGVVSNGGQSQLVLTARDSGAGSQITLDVSAMPAGTLKDTLSAAPTQLVGAQDAIATISGMTITQSSNTFTAVQGVSMSFTQTGNATLTVSNDASGTAANVQSFVTAYNTLEKALDGLTDSGSVEDGKAAGPMSADSGVRALRDKLNMLLRQSVNGVSLADYGVIGDRSGNLTLDTTRLQTRLAANPTGLDALFGSASYTSSSGVLGSMDKLMGSWLNSASGLIQSRRASVTATQRSLTDRQTRLQTQYQNAYDRYLKQFSALQSLQAQMSQTSDMFFNPSSSN